MGGASQRMTALLRVLAPLIALIFADGSLAADLNSVTLSDTGGAPVTVDSDRDVVLYRFGGDDIQPRVSFGFTTSDTRTATYASAGLELPIGRVDIGRPRSILDEGPLSGIIIPEAGFRSLAGEQALDENLGPGFRLAGIQGPVSFGTSIHWTENDQSTVLGLLGRYDARKVAPLDGVAVYAGTESDGQINQFRLGTEIVDGKAKIGLGLLRDDSDERTERGLIYLGYAPNEGFDIGLSGWRDFQDAAPDDSTRLGLSASVQTETGAIFRGTVDGLSSDDPAFDFSVGFEF